MKTALPLILCFFCLNLVTRGQDADLAKGVLEKATALASSAQTARRSSIESQLSAMGVKYRRLPWQEMRTKGTNIEVQFGDPTKPAWFFTAHFDCRKGSKGANNNASGCAVLMQLIQAFKTKLASDGANIVFAFLDGGESRHAGAKSMCRAHVGKNIVAVFNFDLCGRGDRLVFGPSMKPTCNASAHWVGSVAAAHKAGASSMSFASDHRGFASFGIDAVTIATVPSDQWDAFQKRFASNDSKQRMPKFFTEAIRGSDPASILEKGALQKTFLLAHDVIGKIQDVKQKELGSQVILDLSKKRKDFVTVLEEGSFEEVRKAAGELGFSCLLEVLAKTVSKKEELRDKALPLIPRLVSGKELRASLVKLLEEGAETDLETLRESKPFIVWDKDKLYFKSLK